MCLAIPSKIVNIDGDMAVIDVDGVRRECSLLMIEDPKVGEYVIVHAGFAISVLDEDEAQKSFEVWREMIESAEEQGPDGGVGALEARDQE